MKRTVAVIIVMAMALSVLAMTAGCKEKTSADKTKAMEYMSEGDRLYGMADDLNSEMQKSQASLMGVWVSNPQQAQAILDDMKMKGEKANEYLDQAKGQYEAILSLSGVSDYVEYANMMIACIQKYKEYLAAGGVLMGQLPPVGQPIDTAKLMGSEAFKNMSNLKSETDKLRNDAVKFQEQKALRG